MGIYRVFAGSDGESHMEELRLEEHPALGALTNIHEVRVQQFDGTRKRDFHPLPERRLIIHLSGEVEIGTSDGSRQVFRAGDIRLMEDVTGRGHAHVDRSPSSAVYVLLKDEDGGSSRERAQAVLGMRLLTERVRSRRDMLKTEPPLTKIQSHHWGCAEGLGCDEPGIKVLL